MDRLVVTVLGFQKQKARLPDMVQIMFQDKFFFVFVFVFPCADHILISIYASLWKFSQRLLTLTCWSNLKYFPL